MKNLLRLFLLLILCGFLPGKCIAQLDIWKLDTAIWRLDTNERIVIVIPRFELQADTTINFYELQNGKKKNVLTLIYRHRIKYFYGHFKGSQKFAYSGYYLESNFGITKDLDLSQMADSIVHDSLYTHYFVHHQSFGITEQMRKALDLPYEDYFKIGKMDKEKVITIYEVISTTDANPPYFQKTKTIVRTVYN